MTSNAKEWIRLAVIFRELWKKYCRAAGPGAKWHARDFRHAMRACAKEAIQ